jgi:hypothetical protein
MVDSLVTTATYRLRKKLQSSSTDAPKVRKKRSVGVPSVFWRPGQTLRISFLGNPDQWLKHAIVETASKWLKHAHLGFELVDDNDERAEIRIDTQAPEDVNYSYLGTQSIGLEGASMVLGVRLSSPLFEVIVLHEFGHALGMEHEHQHPQANIPWDLNALRRSLKDALRSEIEDLEALSEAVEEELDTQFLPLPDHGENLLLPYDRNSIMHYGIRQEHTLGNWTARQNLKISKKDKRFMRLVYPTPCRTCS